jgi:hypothetical protein
LDMETAMLFRNNLKSRWDYLPVYIKKQYRLNLD